MEWLELNLEESKREYNNLDFNNLEFTGNRIYKGLNLELEELFYEVEQKVDLDEYMRTKRKYCIDYLFGIELFKKLNEKKYNITLYEASNNDFWRYLSLKIIPKLVYERWGENEAHFYKTPNRIWLKQVWWYIYLSLQYKYENGRYVVDYSKTEKVLSYLNTDFEVQIIDRSGYEGFNIKLIREIIRNMPKLDLDNRDEYRNLMKLNTARLKIIDPNLYKGGINGYVKDLFLEFIDEEKWNESKY